MFNMPFTLVFTGAAQKDGDPISIRFGDRPYGAEPHDLTMSLSLLERAVLRALCEEVIRELDRTEGPKPPPGPSRRETRKKGWERG